MSADDPLTFLRGWGFSESQARAYCCLLAQGGADARELSRLSRIPVGRIYAVVEKLKERGLVEVIPDTPRRFVPLPIDDVLDGRKGQLLAEISRVEAEREHARHLFAQKSAPGANDRGPIVIVRGRQTASRQVQKALAAATERVTYLAPLGSARRGVVLPLLVEAARRGVEVRVLLASGSPAISSQGDPPSLGFRARSADARRSLSAGVLVVDNKLALMVHFVPDDAGHHDAKDVGVIVQEEVLAATFGEMLDRAWETAPELSAGTVGVAK